MAGLPTMRFSRKLQASKYPDDVWINISGLRKAPRLYHRKSPVKSTGEKIALEKYADKKANLPIKRFVCKYTCWGIQYTIHPPLLEDQYVLEKYKNGTNCIDFSLSHMSLCITHVQSAEEEESFTILR